MNCDRIARWYRLLEYLSFGPLLEHRRRAYLRKQEKARRALVCGDGDGRFTAALLAANQRVQVDAVDSSAAMVELASRRAAALGSSAAGRVRFHHADARVFVPPHRGYDLIATHFFLDCFQDAEARALIHRLAEYASTEACWVISDFYRLPGRWGRLWTGALIDILYAFFRVTTGLRVRRLPDYAPALLETGFALRQCESALGGLLRSEWWERESVSLGVRENG